MGFTRDPHTPEDVRTVLQVMYDRYTTGADLFPRVRYLSDPEALPKKTRPLAAALLRAWDVINEDREFFEASLLHCVGATKGTEHTGARRAVITRIGKNAVNLGIVDGGEHPVVTFGQFPRQEFVEQFEGKSLTLTDGRQITLMDGRMVGDYDLSVVRRSNVAGMAISQALPRIEDVDTTLV
jgi:hypothetical protein